MKNVYQSTIFLQKKLKLYVLKKTQSFHSAFYIIFYVIELLYQHHLLNVNEIPGFNPVKIHSAGKFCSVEIHFVKSCI